MNPILRSQMAVLRGQLIHHRTTQIHRLPQYLKGPQSHLRRGLVSTRANIHTSRMAPIANPSMSPHPPPQRPPAEGELVTLRLPTGRRITYRCYGPASGKPLFYLHGTPSSACESASFKPFTDSRDIRVIGPNRPGFGQSDLQPGRTISDHAHDIMAIADSLGYDKFRVMGGSGGGPYSLACANVIPKDRLAGVAVLAGLAPANLGTKGMDWQGLMRYFGVKYLGWLFAPMTRYVFNTKIKGKSYEEKAELFRKDIVIIGKSLGEKDKAAIANEEVVKEAIDSFIEAYETTADGALEDSALLVSDWGFKLEDIPYEGIKLYFGTEDKATPVYPAREMQKILKKAEIIEFEGEGHWSVTLNKGGEIFDDFFKQELLK